MFKLQTCDFESFLCNTPNQVTAHTPTKCCPFSWQDSPKCLFIGIGALPCHCLSCAWHVWAGTIRALACWGTHCIGGSGKQRRTRLQQLFFFQGDTAGQLRLARYLPRGGADVPELLYVMSHLILLKLCLSYGEHTDYDGFTFLWRNATNGLQVAVFNNH